MATFDTLPLFATETLKWYPMGTTVTGGGTFTGPGQVAEFSGGGWWCAELTGLDLADAADIRLMRALLGRAAFGAGRFIVPMVEDPLRAPPDPVPFGDDAPFSDDSLFEGSAVTATLTADAALRATTLQITCDVALAGGEVFTLVHETHGPRLYLILGVDAVEGDAYTINTLPPLREAAEAGAALDFDRPRCVMRIDDPNGAAWPTIQPGWDAKTSLRFVEAFDHLEDA